MILKLSTGNGWRFIDKIVEAEVELPQKKFDYKEIGNVEVCTHIVGETKSKIIKYWVKGSESHNLANFIKIQNDIIAYLLNDEGKTIERLN